MHHAESPYRRQSPGLRRLGATVAGLALIGTGCSAEPESPASPSESPFPSGSSWASPSPTASASPTDQSSPTPTKAAEPQQPETVARHLEAPWSVAFHGDTALVSERDSGRILELTADGTREVGVIDGAVEQSGTGEGGLLGIAVHEGSLYTYFTTESENRIERRDLTGEPGSLGIGQPQVVLEGIPASNYHNGGRIAFGPDGKLYATVGDASESSNAQDRESLAGKILRMEPDGSVPADNPFGSLVYSYGHRNPQGIARGPDGTLYASEFGQDTWDELNVIEPGGNYGWPEAEGIAEQEGFIDPVQQWTPDEASPSGITIAHDTIYIANLRGERLRQVPLDDLGSATERYVGEYGRLRDVVTTPDGAVWLVSNNTDGRGEPGDGDDQIRNIPWS